jgi:hypothetical protein
MKIGAIQIIDASEAKHFQPIFQGIAWYVSTNGLNFNPLVNASYLGF